MGRAGIIKGNFLPPREIIELAGLGDGREATTPLEQYEAIMWRESVLPSSGVKVLFTHLYGVMWYCVGRESELNFDLSHALRPKNFRGALGNSLACTRTGPIWTHSDGYLIRFWLSRPGNVV